MQFVNLLYINALQCHYRIYFLWAGAVKIPESKAHGNGRQKVCKKSHNQNRGIGGKSKEEVRKLAVNKNSGIGSDGKRTGAGRKSKPLADKILEGNSGKRALKKIEFENGLTFAAK